jgi:hypothetical protein
MKSLKSFLAIAAMTAFIIDLDGQISTPGTGLTASAVIGKIIEKTGAPVIPNTVDVIKEGNPETLITGIVTTMFATMPVM